MGRRPYVFITCGSAESGPAEEAGAAGSLSGAFMGEGSTRGGGVAILKAEAA